eukprot:PhM_4_TR17247/c0_g1_i1/m.15720
MEGMQHWFNTIPFSCRLIAAICFLALVPESLGITHVSSLCSSYVTVVVSRDPLRLLTSTFCHHGVLHFFFNMLCLWGIGPNVERYYGSGGFLLFVIAAACLQQILMMLFGAVLLYFFHAVEACAIGFSGVLFSIMMIESMSSSFSQVLLCGLIPVPTKWYPVALLLLLQVLFPSSSFVGHLAGIAVGWGLHYTTNSATYSCADRYLPSWVISSDGYILSTNSVLPGGGMTWAMAAPPPGTTTDSSSLLPQLGQQHTFPGTGRSLR